MEEDEDEIQQGCDINDSVKEELTDIFTLKEEAIVIDEHWTAESCVCNIFIQCQKTFCRFIDLAEHMVLKNHATGVTVLWRDLVCEAGMEERCPLERCSRV